jgi:hypothetical protein
MLTLFKQPEATRVYDLPLDEHLTFLIRYGRPRLSYLDKGWYCKVEMNTNTTGTQFDVSSEFGHLNPNEAVKQCHERIDAALNQLKVTV